MHQTRPVGTVFKVMVMGALFALLCPKGWAAAKAPAPLTFSESWGDKEVCTGSNGQDDLDCETASIGKFILKAVISSNDFGATIDPTQFNENTTFDISVGDYLFSDTLGGSNVADGGFVPGATKVKFQLSGEVCSAKDNDNFLPCPTKIYETITLSWTTEAVTITISAKTGTDANGNTFESAIDADNFDGDDTGAVTDTLSFEMDLGSLSVFSDILPVTGTVTTKTITDKSQDQDTLSNIKISGTLSEADLGQ